MKNLKFKIIYVAFLFVSVLSCSKDKNTSNDGPTTVADDKKNIEATFDNSLNCVMQVKDGDLFQAIVQFLKLQNGDALNEVWAEDLGAKFDDITNLQWIDDNSRFSLNQFAGNYTWNNASQNWIKTTSGEVIINFPSEKTQTTNNCTFKIIEYTDASYLVNDETVYLPTSIKANLTKNNSELFNLSMVCTYATTGFPVPLDATINVVLSPYTYAFKIKRLTNTQFDVNAAMFSGSDCATTLDTKVSFAHDDYENIDFETDVNNIQSDFNKGALNINGTWDIKTYNDLSNATTDQLNSTINIVVNYNQQKIGDLRFKDVGNQDELFVFYKDGTSENTSIYYDPFYSDFKAICNPYFGDLSFKKAVTKSYLHWKLKNLKSNISGWLK